MKTAFYKRINTRNSILAALTMVYFLVCSIFVTDIYSFFASLIMSVGFFLVLFYIFDLNDSFLTMRNIFSLIFFVFGVHLRFIYILANKESFGSFLVVSSLTSKGESHLKTALLILAFEIFFAFGLTFGSKRHLNAASRLNTKKKSSIQNSFFLFVVYIFLFFVWTFYRIRNIRIATSDTFGTFDNFFNVIETFERMVAYIYLISFFKEKRVSKLFFSLIFLTTSIVFSLLSLYKGPILYELIALFTIITIFHKKSAIKYGIVLLFVFLLVLPLITVLRANQVSGASTDISFSVFADYYSKNNPLTYITDRLSYYDEAYYVCNLSKSSISLFRDESGNIFANFAASFIPRFLWPSKPVVSMGHSITYNLCQLPDYIYTNLAVGVVGESFAFGGAVLSAFIAFLYGAIVGRSQLRSSNPSDVISLAFYIMIGRTMLSAIDGNIVAILVSLVVTFVFWKALSLFDSNYKSMPLARKIFNI